MGSIENTVYYCCVSKGNRILYAYSGGGHEIENLAALCLERAPPFHKWYFQTMGKKTFGFLMEDGHVYFAIVDEGLGKPGVLQFLEHMRDEFKKVARKDSRGSPSSFNSLHIQDQLVPIIHRLISSLEHVSQTSNNWIAESPLPHHVGLSPSPSDTNGQMEAASSTKAPLLGKFSKQEKKKKMKDPVIAMRDIELEEHRKSTDRGIKIDSGNLDSNSQGGVGSSISLQKDLGSIRIRSGSQSIRKKWCRHVRIVLAIDAAVCLILFLIWLVIFHITKK
ncbi:hypothetical protein PVL29_025086 [Vitis rotundifolia]|uniref:Longin domain-containing protein n=1 Tax=Vitis rotundifolia TaxID=103349 RepID=A0AA39DBP1_VITRO|nr:hypothetical protein PVL29_025086 [Vitis rotundifolia]